MTAPYSVQLDADTARNLAVGGASLLLLDVPEGTPIGVDQQVFLTGPRFRGLKMLPPGVHFLSWQARGKDGALSPPVSTLLLLAPRQVLVRRWDAAREGLVHLEDEDEEARYAAGVARFDFDRELAPYDLARYAQWTSLSCHITEALLHKLLPACGEISVMAEAVDPGLMDPRSAAERRLQQQLEEGRACAEAAMQVDRPAPEQPDQTPATAAPEPAPVSAPARGGRCRYSTLPRLIKLPGAPAAQLTALNLDKTSLLEQVLARDSSSQHAQQQPRGIDVVAELQLAFIAFVLGQSLEGYLQWKQLLVLLLGCVSGPLETHTALFVAFLAALTAQLQFGFCLGPLGSQPGGAGARQQAAGGGGQPEAQLQPGAALLGEGLVDELLPDSFLKQAFRGFFEMLQEAGASAPAPLLAQARQLEAVLAQGLGWDFRLAELRLGSDSDAESDEYGPRVVELSDAQLADLAAAGQ